MALLADLAALDPHLRRGAARRLGAYPETATSLGGAIGIEAVGSVRESIFTALIRIGTKLAAAGLVPLLQSQDPGLRNGAMEALKTMPEFAAECLGEIFASASDVRIFGVEILGALPSSDRLHWLRRVAEEETEVNVCAVAVDTLVKSGDSEAASPLLQLLSAFRTSHTLSLLFFPRWRVSKTATSGNHAQDDGRSRDASVKVDGRPRRRRSQGRNERKCPAT